MSVPRRVCRPGRTPSRSPNTPSSTSPDGRITRSRRRGRSSRRKPKLGAGCISRPPAEFVWRAAAGRDVRQKIENVPTAEADMVRRIAIYALIVLALFGAWLGLIGREYDALKPRGPMLADLLVTLPDPSEVEAFNCRGEAYVVVYGRNELSFRIPSG